MHGSMNIQSEKHTPVNHMYNFWTAVTKLCDSERFAGDLNECLTYGFYMSHSQPGRKVRWQQRVGFQKPTLSTGHCKFKVVSFMKLNLQQ